MHNKVKVEAFVITKVALKKSSSADALTRGSITTGDDRDLLDYLNFACSFIEFSTSPSENHSKNSKIKLSKQKSKDCAWLYTWSRFLSLLKMTPTITKGNLRQIFSPQIDLLIALFSTSNRAQIKVISSNNFLSLPFAITFSSFFSTSFSTAFIYC